ncbi:MAG TPA: response regulator [Thermodesulfobacteriota bacterium]
MTNAGALILCVDDEADICQLLDTILTMSGYRTVLAETADQALAHMSARPDLVILDVNLPGVDGIEACRRLRRRDPRIPVLFLTAATNARRREAMAAGGSAFLEKPFDVDELLDVIERLVARGHERRVHERRQQDACWHGSERRAGDRREEEAWTDGHTRPAANPPVDGFAADRSSACDGYPPIVARSRGETRGRSSRGA